MLDWSHARPLTGTAVSVPHRQPCSCGYCGGGEVVTVVMGDTAGALAARRRMEHPAG